METKYILGTVVYNDFCCPLKLSQLILVKNNSLHDGSCSRGCCLPGTAGTQGTHFCASLLDYSIINDLKLFIIIPPPSYKDVLSWHDKFKRSEKLFWIMQTSSKCVHIPTHSTLDHDQMFCWFSQPRIAHCCSISKVYMDFGSRKKKESITVAGKNQRWIFYAFCLSLILIFLFAGKMVALKFYAKTFWTLTFLIS